MVVVSINNKNKWNVAAIILFVLVGSCRVLSSSSSSEATTTTDDDQTTRSIVDTWWQEKRNDADTRTLPSGLMVKRLQNGTGDSHPSFDTYCKVDMEVSRIIITQNDEDGSSSSSSGSGTTPILTTKVVASTTLGDPPLVRPDDSMPAVREALLLMVEGDWWELYVPSELGYDNDHNKNHHGDKNNNTPLLISLELVELLGGDKIPKGERHTCQIQLVWRDEQQEQDPAENNTAAMEPPYYYRILPRQDTLCEERDVKYIEKVAGWGVDRSSKADAELTRLRSVLISKGNNHHHNMKQHLALWVRRRIHILKQFLREEMRICTIHYPDDDDDDDNSSETTTTAPAVPILKMSDCNVQEQDYVAKVHNWDRQRITEEIQRLDHLDQDSIDAALGSWVRRRIRILKQIIQTTTTAIPNNDNYSHNGAAAPFPPIIEEENVETAGGGTAATEEEIQQEQQQQPPPEAPNEGIHQEL